MSLMQASFFWKNNQPDGIGFSFGPPTFSTKELEMIFEGETLKTFIRKSDESLGHGIVETMINQLEAVATMRRLGDTVSPRLAVLAALNIIWLSSRGFIPNDEFNGSQFVHTTKV